MSSEGGRRIAMVVATTEYDDARLARLAAPLSDALELARTLGDHGAFEVESLVNAEAQTVQRRLERFCKAGRQRSDLLLIYLTGHGVKDDDGNLYFALRDTDRDLLRTTALSADLLSSILNESPAGGQILMLDCCYSGAISRALRPKGSGEVDLAGTFGGGRGRVVLAASGAIEQAWEGEKGSLYTHAVVEGIASGAADLNADGRITAGEIHAYTAEKLRAEGRQSPRKFEFDDAGALVVARPGNRAPASVPLGSAKQDRRPPETRRPAISVDRSTRQRSSRGAPAWIPGMLAVALAATLGTLWLTGAISFLPSPLATTTTAPTPPTTASSIAAAGTTPGGLTTAGTAFSTTAGIAASTTLAEGTTTAGPVVSFQLVFEDRFDGNINGWTEGDFSDDTSSSSYHFADGTYVAGFSDASPNQTYYSTIPFEPGSSLYYIETTTTALQPGSECGLAIENQVASLFVVVVGNGQLSVRSFVEDTLTNQASYEVTIDGASQAEVGLWIDGSSVTLYLQDGEIDTFVEPAVLGTQQIGVGLLGGLDVECAFDYLNVWTG